MTLKRLSLEEFNTFAEAAHRLMFHEERPAWLNRYDFILMVEDDDECLTPLGYMACQEIDASTIWVMHGGGFASSRGNGKLAKGFRLMVNHLREQYTEARIDTKNTNISMIKLAYSSGFLILGTEIQRNDLYLNMKADFSVNHAY